MIHKFSERTVGNKSECVICGPIAEVKDLIEQLRTMFDGVYITQSNHDNGFLTARVLMYTEEADNGEAQDCA